ncbi:efflux RND transporter periplasmic adaptor subunit [Sphingobium aquiterrae]|uniref:efflux RND transporter periplasmic adaptor subunit n=1 Tax=Sphingobium aquiterrae TaxID=2038656 RepID=UPI00301795D4
MRISVVFSLAALMLAACGSGQQHKPRPTPLVEAQPVGSASFTDAIEAVGTAMANEQVVLAAPVTQRITSLNFTDGGFVQRGQVIATLSQGQEAAQLAAATANEQQAALQLTRIQALKARGFATNADLEAQAATATATRANAALARASISDRVVRAPFAGYASLRTISVGAVVPVGTAIATISDISRIKLDFTVPETLLSSIKEGQPITAISAAFPDRPFQGIIATIDPVIDSATRAVKVRAILPNPDKALKPGMLLTVKVLSRQRSALAVPELAVVGDGDKSLVFVVTGTGKDRKVVRTPVKIGMRDRGLVEVTDGIRAGQVVVTEGVVKLSDGMPVQLTTDKPEDGLKDSGARGGKAHGGPSGPGATGRPAG